MRSGSSAACADRAPKAPRQARVRVASAFLLFIIIGEAPYREAGEPADKG
jgi:hypothetical protein